LTGANGNGDCQRWEKQTHPDAFAFVHGSVETPTRGSRGKVPFDDIIIFTDE